LRATQRVLWYDLVDKACVVLFWAVVKHAENAERCAREDGVDTFVRVVDMYGHQEVIKSIACSLLCVTTVGSCDVEDETDHVSFTGKSEVDGINTWNLEHSAAL
jgi:hypothetical protein